MKNKIRKPKLIRKPETKQLNLEILPNNRYIICVSSDLPYFTRKFSKSNDIISITFMLTNELEFGKLFADNVVIEIKYLNPDGSKIEGILFSYVASAFAYDLCGDYTSEDIDGIANVALMTIKYKITKDIT